MSKYGYAKISYPGGCTIGARPIDFHVNGFQKLGATVKVEDDNIYVIEGKNLVGNDIFLDMASVGATINIMFASVKAKGTTAEVADASRAVTSNVTIWSGAGADSINVTEDTIAGSNGAHVFEYRLGDGNDTIFGYNNNDSIVFKNANGSGAMTGVAFSADVNSSHNYVITIKQGTTIVGTLTLQKPSNQGELYATKLNIYNGTNQLTGENTEGIYKIKPEPEDSSKDYWGIPYKITGTDSSDQALGANKENFIINDVKFALIINKNRSNSMLLFLLCCNAHIVTSFHGFIYTLLLHVES